MGIFDLELNLPTFTEMNLPDPSMIDYYKNLDKRVIWIDDDITEATLDVARKIIEWNEEDTKMSRDNVIPIKLYFNSNGGYLDEALSIAQVVKTSKTPVIGINVGSCCSGAALIYSQCHQRYATETAYWLVHKGATGGNGSSTYQQSKLGQTHYDHRIEQMMNMIYDGFDHDALNREDFDKLADSEWYFYMSHEDEQKDARKLGFVHPVDTYISEIIPLEN